MEECLERSEVRVLDGLLDKGSWFWVIFGPMFEVVFCGLGFGGKTFGHSIVPLCLPSMFKRCSEGIVVWDELLTEGMVGVTTSMRPLLDA